ncbi:STAS/SEC14 domain-containing protein [uncultured Microscilla sp.]|uniref:STAS/SEC14 domain-containing protein n=1 Tax=uncultured Microscilla sp. TaxID=432653 RepID=UPI0026361A65|nr:STAS/SEC14 domain-containing protein [uncultured Microscilla sp.]
MRTQISTLSNNYFTAYIDKDVGLYELYWHEASADMTDEDYQTLLSEGLKVLIDEGYISSFKYQLLDNRFNFFTISPDLQEWQQENIGKKIIEMLEEYPKTAFIQNDDFITQLSFEQTLEEMEARDVRYFNNIEDAKAWLFNDA